MVARPRQQSCHGIDAVLHAIGAGRDSSRGCRAVDYCSRTLHYHVNDSMAATDCHSASEAAAVCASTCAHGLFRHRADAVAPERAFRLLFEFCCHRADELVREGVESSKSVVNYVALIKHGRFAATLWENSASEFPDLFFADGGILLTPKI
eukprot:4221575-Pleurochrysis_carterae.AAC.2